MVVKVALEREGSVTAPCARRRLRTECGVTGGEFVEALFAKSPNRALPGLVLGDVASVCKGQMQRKNAAGNERPRDSAESGRSVA